MVTDKEWLLDVNIAYEKGKSKGRADAIDECIKTITNLCGGLPNINIIGALEKLKEQKNDKR